MKTLFIGGIKSGKSRNAEKYIQNLSDKKPIYLATTEFIDEDMYKKIQEHKEARKDKFITVEEALNLKEKISLESGAVLIECLSMWINNMLYHEKSFLDMQAEINALLELDRDIVFVMNDVSGGVIPENKLAREFVDISGRISQLVAASCDEVYHVIAGISSRIK